jgi:hypothetical protein
MRAGLVLLLSIAAAVGLVRAESSSDVLAFFQNTADALTNEDASVFLDHFDRNMPDYATLQTNIEGLLAAYEVGSTIEIVSDEGDTEKRSLALDWVLITEQKAAARGDRTTRRRIVNCKIERRGKQWKITSIEPVDFFK